MPRRTDTAGTTAVARAAAAAIPVVSNPRISAHAMRSEFSASCCFSHARRGHFPAGRSTSYGSSRKKARPARKCSCCPWLCCLLSGPNQPEGSKECGSVSLRLQVCPMERKGSQLTTLTQSAATVGCAQTTLWISPSVPALLVQLTTDIGSLPLQPAGISL